MPISPELSKFTACVLGEAPDADQAVFDKAVMSDPSLREEALALSRTAHGLAEALKQETPVFLTLPQRHAVLEFGSVTTGSPTRRLLSSVPGTTTSRLHKPASRSWLTPTLVTGAVAAALMVGLFVLPGLGGKRQAPAAGGSGFPAVAIQPAAPGKTLFKPVAPPPAVATGNHPAAAIPDALSPETPVNIIPAPAMAATPPVIKVIPAETPASARQAPAQLATGTEDRSAPRKPEGLAAPAPLPPAAPSFTPKP